MVAQERIPSARMRTMADKLILPYPLSQGLRATFSKKNGARNVPGAVFSSAGKA
jgi:hypothetical protein